MIKLLISEWNYMNNIWVDADMIWTPNLYFSNRVQDFGPSLEVELRANIQFDGRVTFYRSLRLVFKNVTRSLIGRVTFILNTDQRIRAAYTSSATNYPYDTQVTELQIQSRDYSKVFVVINTHSMNKAYGLHEDDKEMEPTDQLKIMQNELFATRNVSSTRK